MSTGLALFLLFTAVPAVETYLLVTIGGWVGAGETVLYLLATGVVGAWLGKRAGFAVLREVFTDLQRGAPPADRLVEAALVLVGSALLVTPGVLTDIVGMLLFVAAARRWLAPRVKRRLLAWLSGRGVHVGAAGPGPNAPDGWRPSSGAPPGPSPRARSPRATFEHPTQD